MVGFCHCGNMPASHDGDGGDDCDDDDDGDDGDAGDDDDDNATPRAAHILMGTLVPGALLW